MRHTLKSNSVVGKCLEASRPKMGLYIHVSAFSKDAGDCKLVFLLKIQALFSRVSPLGSKMQEPWPYFVCVCVCVCVCVFLPFLGPLPWHMEVPRLGVQSEL